MRQKPLFPICYSGLSYCIPNADKCVVGKGDKSFNLLVSKARFVIANVVAHAPRQDGDGPDESTMAMRDAIENSYYNERGAECTFATFEDVYNSFQGDIGNEPIPSIKRI